MKKIYTVTLNPAIDYYIEMDEFKEGSLNKLNTAYTLPGGKGINVSKVLKNFDVTSIALGFVGGFTGNFIRKNVRAYGVLESFTEILDDNRINTKMKTKKTETEIAGRSPNISKEELDKFLEELSHIKTGDTLVLSGSVPASIPQNIYTNIIKSLDKDIKIILDTTKDSLRDAIKEGVYLVKPNNHELEEFFGEKYTNIDEIILAGKKLQALGSENVIVSLGKDGSILITKDNVYRGNVPKGTLVSSVGAGDSMVAGLLYGLSHGHTIEESYKFAIASGSGTAFSEGLVTLETMKSLLNDINIIKL